MTTPTDGKAEQTIDTTADPAALYRLMTWLSPQFPVGSYTYSHGIEQAVDSGLVGSTVGARDWIEDIVARGAGRTDAIIVRHTHAAAEAQCWTSLAQAAELAAALQPTSELALESQAQGRAFLETVRKAWDCRSLTALAAHWPGPYAYPVAVATAAAGHGIPVEPALQAYLHAFVSNLVSAAVRLVPLGQTDGQRLIAALEPVIALTAHEALRSSLDDVGGGAIMNDICSMRHETQYSRLFRS